MDAVSKTVKLFFGADTGFKWAGGQDFLGTKKLIIRNKKIFF